MASPPPTAPNTNIAAAHVWRREWVKGAPGTAPFPSQIGTPSPLAGAVTIVSGSVSQLPMPPNPLALSGSLGAVVNPVTGKQTLYMFNGVVWTPLLNTTASGSGGSGGGGISNVTVAGGTGISVTGGPAYFVALQTPVTIANGGTGSTTAALSGGGGISASGTFPNQTIFATVPLPTYPLSVASGGTDVTSLVALSGTFVLLSPASQQTGAINVSGKINSALAVTAGGAFAATTGDIGAARAAAIAGYWFGSASGTAGLIDYGATTTGVYTFGDGASKAHPLVAGSSVSGAVGSYVPPLYSLSGTAKAPTAHFVKDVVLGGAGVSTTATLTNAAAFTNSAQYFVFDNTTAAAAVITGVALNSVTFASVTGQAYSIFAVGD